MSTKANTDIRETAKRNGVYLWQIAERLCINDGNFSRKLRRELPEAEKQNIIHIISQIAAENAGV